ncbi:cytochrome P450 [Gloeophyllum trabeum ATCC 11539]|uniref:Cytochrome P450 n=1 Tax=Gloeophyllum trabeum (strain ATCC 11539 / FP-39264 / Madison 617) TaxID=670483 RepID=S7R8G1_GLOTA|nr:cytochrome P450 [Gloeophyllum trabeum ATCC 11539]EPQ50605.1 cytochrome P450 [Gloeophyllum trabeum ATCC 11539]
MWASFVLLALLICVASRISKFLDGLKKVGYLPGFRCAFASMSFPGSMLPTNYFNPGFDWCWKWKHIVYTRSIDVAKQILCSPQGYWKDPEHVAPLTIWGDSLLTVNHDVHRKHRRIVGPAFNGSRQALLRLSIYTLVAQETSRLYADMMESEGWCKQATVNLEPINPHLGKFTLGVISRCGFGLPFPWTSDTAEGMSFDRALTVVSAGTILRLIVPRWAYKLPIKRLHEIDEAFTNLAAFMRTFVSDKKAELATKGDGTGGLKGDLFTRLVAASEAEGKNGLEDQELGVLCSGNPPVANEDPETTAHVLQACLAMLALQPEEQEVCYENITRVLGESRDPTLEDFDALDKVVACFQEAARMFRT